MSDRPDPAIPTPHTPPPRNVDGDGDAVDHIVVVAGSAPLAAHVVEAIDPAAIVLAADSGLDAARDAGLRPSGQIGDLDSVSAEGLAWAEEHSIISRHPGDKDLTDTELALAFAADMNPDRLTLVGGGDRLDHSLAAIGALGSPTLTSVPVVDGWWDGHHLDVLHGPDRRTLVLEPGSTFSVIALHGRCSGVVLDGARWPLDGVTVEPSAGFGISNEVAGEDGRVKVGVTDGVLTVFDVPSRSDPSTSSTGPPEAAAVAASDTASNARSGATTVPTPTPSSPDHSPNPSKDT